MVNKIAELDEDFNLLNQVDRKLSRKHRKQHGGATVELKELQKQALIKRLQIEQQNEDLQKAIQSATDLTAKVAQINDALVQIRNDISGINVKSVNLSGIDVPNVETIRAKALEAIGAYKVAAVKNGFAGFNEAVLGLNDAQMTEAGMTVDNFLELFAEVLNSVHEGSSVTLDKMKDIHTRVSTSVPWDEAATGISEKVFDKIVAANSTASFASKYSFW